MGWGVQILVPEVELLEPKAQGKNEKRCQYRCRWTPGVSLPFLARSKNEPRRRVTSPIPSPHPRA